MGYVGAKLEPMYHSRPLANALRRSTYMAGRRLHELVVQNTPINDGPEPSRPPGTLRRSFQRSRVRLRPLAGLVAVYEVDVFSEDDVAPHVEYGTGLWGPKGAKYLIEPKRPGGWLTWIDRATGKRVFARRVMHPGSPGQAMVRLSIGKLEAQIDAGYLEPQLHLFRRQVESQARGRPVPIWVEP